MQRVEIVSRLSWLKSSQSAVSIEAQPHREYPYGENEHDENELGVSGVFRADMLLAAHNPFYYFLVNSMYIL